MANASSSAGRQDLINERLQTLADALRQGQMSQEQYRSRRRSLLTGVLGDDTTTTRKPVRSSPAPAASAAAARPAAGAAPAVPGRRPAVIAAGVIVLLAAIVAIGFYLGRRGDEPVAGRTASPPMTVPVAAAGGEAVTVQRLRLLATRFIDANRWEAEDIDAAVAAWSAEPEDARREAAGSAEVARWREQVSYKLGVTTLLLDDTEPDEGRARQVEALQRLERELARR